MDSLICKYCRERSSVTPSTQYIRCHGCRRALSVGSTEDEVLPKGLSLETKKKMTEEKERCLRVRKKFLGSNGQHGQTSSQPPSVITQNPPPRGKRALLCGITYKKQKYELKGTAQDVKNMRDLLVKRFRFPEESILILAEDETYRPPTRKNIEDAFQWLMRGIQSGDSLVFYFSGHGLRQHDFQGDEIDGFDETICPVDFQSNGNILDNCINEAIVRPLIPGVTLHAIVDCCHSGTMLDLPHVYNINTHCRANRVALFNLKWKFTSLELLDSYIKKLVSSASCTRNLIEIPHLSKLHERREWDDNHPPSGTYKGTSGGKAICFSACEDYQQAADTTAFSTEKEMTGAMTYTFIRAIEEAVASNNQITYQGILESMHETLKQAHKSGFRAGIRRLFHRKILQVVYGGVYATFREMLA
ncbi:UNVERIFIED_CONTAM: Metacaspase-1 [Sesamum latifolium]|uniref:Metacaspase-1 n=1 Tax=Sesamum latifolium TaxID=2727402 RepID=A0AAW2V0G5_9LAMI